MSGAEEKTPTQPTHTNRMKLDYNNLMSELVEILTNEEYGIDPMYAFSVGIGLERLQSYLMEIAQLAIEREDEQLLVLCKGLMIVTENDDDGTD